MYLQSNSAITLVTVSLLQLHLQYTELLLCYTTAWNGLRLARGILLKNIFLACVYIQQLKTDTLSIFINTDKSQTHKAHVSCMPPQIQTHPNNTKTMSSHS